jgi:hypothetical protein
MPVTVYRSTDGSAPVLDGTAGSLVNLLDKCLVAGYGTKAAAGWTKPYTGTAAAVFRQGGGNSMCLDVNDNTPTVANEARVRGYEAMTAVATGTGPFPTVAQQTAGIIIRKSAAASGTTRAWTLIADDRSFYLLNQAGDTAGCWYCFSFGDFYSYLTGTDGYRTLIVGRTTENSSTLTLEQADKMSSFANIAGHYIARTYTGLGAAVTCGFAGDTAKAGGGSATLVGAMSLPNPADGRVWIAPVIVTEGSAGGVGTTIRGQVRGFMHWLHAAAAFGDQDTVTGTGPYAGRTFLLFKTTGNAAVYCIDVTGPWDTN